MRVMDKDTVCLFVFGKFVICRDILRFRIIPCAVRDIPYQCSTWAVGLTFCLRLKILRNEDFLEGYLLEIW
jgi:hypothetical protein